MEVSEIPPLTRRTDAGSVALGVYYQLIALLEGLDEDDWDAPTECPGWTVADMVGHVIGAADQLASVRELVRQQLWGLRHRAEFDGNPTDAANALQIRCHADLSPAQRVSALREAAPRGVAGRLRMPAVARWVNVPQQAGGSFVAGLPPAINIGHLVDVIFTRDAWLHTIDIARATGHWPDLGSHVNQRVVADVVAEWARRHGRPFTLELTGPAGGSYTQGTGGETLELDAVEFCRALSGRATVEGLLTTRVYF